MNKQEIEENIVILKSMIPEYERRGRTFGVNALNAAISALTQQLNNGWIPASERLPEDRRYSEGTPIQYSVMIKGAIYPTMLCIDDGGRWFDYVGKYYNVKDLIDYKFEVVAWRNPPEPYKEESK